MKKTKRIKRNNYEKRGGVRLFRRRDRGDNERPGLVRRTMDRFRDRFSNFMNRRQRLAAEQAEEQARILRQEEERNIPKWELTNDREEIISHINSTDVPTGESNLYGREGMTDFEVYALFVDIMGRTRLPETWNSNNRSYAINQLINYWDERPDWIKEKSNLQSIREQFAPFVEIQRSQGDEVAYEAFLNWVEVGRE